MFHAGTTENSAVQTPADRFRVDSFLPIVDKLRTAVTSRRAAYSVISAKFGFLRQFTTLNVQEIDIFMKALVETYTAVLDPHLSGELNFLASILHSAFVSEGGNLTTKKKEAPEL